MRYDEAFSQMDALPVPDLVDRKGREVRVGDRVRAPMYPRGTVEGTVALSTRSLLVRGDHYMRAVVIEADDGSRYDWSAKCLLVEPRSR